MSPITATLVISIAVIALAGLALVLGRPFVVRFGRLEATLEGINHAVNSQPNDRPSLYEQAATAADAAGDIAQCRETLEQLAPLPDKVQVIGDKLEAHLDAHARSDGHRL